MKYLYILFISIILYSCGPNPNPVNPTNNNNNSKDSLITTLDSMIILHTSAGGYYEENEFDFPDSLFSTNIRITFTASTNSDSTLVYLFLYGNNNESDYDTIAVGLNINNSFNFVVNAGSLGIIEGMIMGLEFMDETYFDGEFVRIDHLKIYRVN